MSYNGSGVFNINTAGQPVVTGTVISSTAFNALTADLATGLTTALTKDGQTTPTANIPMGGFKITGIAAATTLGDALSYGRAATVSTLTNSALTSGRVPYASTAGLLVDSSTFTYNGTTVTVPQLTDSGLTSGRVTYAGTGGLLQDSANLTFNGTNLVLLNNSTAQTIILSRTSATARDWALGIDGDGAFRLTDSTSGGVILTAGAAGITTLNAITELVFKANNAEKMRLTSTGLGIGVTSPVCILDISGSTGGQIKFPATQNASSDANTLDDYEEGTWTPIDSSGNGLTFSGVSAYYTKIGDMVFATFELTYPASASSFNNVIGGLPFAAATGAAKNGFHVAYTTYTPGLIAPINANQTDFTLYDTTTTNAINNTALLSKLIRGTCIYKVA